MVPCNSNMHFYIYIHSFLPLKLYEVSPFLRWGGFQGGTAGDIKRREFDP